MFCALEAACRQQNNLYFQLYEEIKHAYYVIIFLLMTIKIEFRGLVNILQDIWLNLKF